MFGPVILLGAFCFEHRRDQRFEHPIVVYKCCSKRIIRECMETVPVHIPVPSMIWMKSEFCIRGWGGSSSLADQTARLTCAHMHIYTYIMHRHMAASSLRHHPPTGLPLKHYCQRGRGCQHKEQCVWRLVWLQLYCCLRSYHLGESFRSHVSASKPKKESQAKPEQDS